MQIDKMTYALHQANMKVSLEKCQFFEKEIEFLGHLVTGSRIKVDPKKLDTIRLFPEPSTMRELRSFLGLANYYRKVVKGFARIAEPLTALLKNHGFVGKRFSPKLQIVLDTDAKQAFELLKLKLQEQIELFQPDFSKPFSLTTTHQTLE